MGATQGPNCWAQRTGFPAALTPATDPPPEAAHAVSPKSGGRAPSPSPLQLPLASAPMAPTLGQMQRRRTHAAGCAPPARALHNSPRFANCYISYQPLRGVSRTSRPRTRRALIGSAAFRPRLRRPGARLHWATSWTCPRLRLPHCPGGGGEASPPVWTKLPASVTDWTTSRAGAFRSRLPSTDAGAPAGLFQALELDASLRRLSSDLNL